MKGGGDSGGNLGGGRTVAQRVLRVLDKRYSVELDASVNSLMKESAGRGKVEEESDDEEGGDDEGKEGGAKEADALFDFMQETFRGGLHAPLAESGASLYLSVDHLQAEVRRLAR